MTSQDNTPDRKVRVEVEITRTFDLDAARCLAEPSFAPPPPDAPESERQAWLQESFYELLTDFRTSSEDHIDGSYVSLVDEDSFVEFRLGGAA